jgi:hypothetical protein
MNPKHLSFAIVASIMAVAIPMGILMSGVFANGNRKE